MGSPRNSLWLAIVSNGQTLRPRFSRSKGGSHWLKPKWRRRWTRSIWSDEIHAESECLEIVDTILSNSMITKCTRNFAFLAVKYISWRRQTQWKLQRKSSLPPHLQDQRWKCDRPRGWSKYGELDNKTSDRPMSFQLQHAHEVINQLVSKSTWGWCRQK